MGRRTVVAMVAALVGGLAIVGPAPVLVGAEDAPALDVSTTSGAGGTVVTVRVPGCVGGPKRLLIPQVVLRSGIGEGALLAGVATSREDPSILRLVVPSWADPDAPARIEAVCLDYTAAFDAIDPEASGPTAPRPVVATRYPTVDFEVLPGGRTDQSVTVAPDHRRLGQTTRVTATGCDVRGASAASVVAYPGADPTGMGVFAVTVPGVYAEGAVEGGRFTVDVSFASGNYGFGYSSSDGSTADDLEVYEEPSDLATGPWTLIPVCGDDGGLVELYPPQAVTIDGRSPSDDVDLVPAGAGTDARHLVLAGGSCPSGPVTATIERQTLDEAFPPYPDGSEDYPDGSEEATTTGSGPMGETVRTRRWEAVGSPLARLAFDPARAAARATDGEQTEGQTEEQAVLAADGSWSIAIDAGFDEGFVIARATCGDPLADGFDYDVQLAAVEATTPPITVPPDTVSPVPTPPAPPSAPAPATARPGRPTYAG